MKTFIFSVFILINTLIFGQTTYFNNVYNINTVKLAQGRSILNKEDTLHIAASIIDTSGLIRILFAKADINTGNIIENKIIGSGYRNYYMGYSGCFQQMKDSNFVIFGTIKDTLQTTSYLLKVASNFDTIFLKEYKDTVFHYLEFQQGKETSDKGFIMVGTLPGSGTYDQNIFVLKADSLGNEQWRKIINLGAIEYARNVIQTPDKGYLLGCYTYTPTNYLSGDGRIIKLDSLGNFEWGKMIGGLKQDGVPVIILAKDSNFIIATSYAYVTYQSADLSELRVQVLKIDKTDGSTIWEKQYDTIRRNNYVSMIKTDNDNNLIIIGYKDMLNGMNYKGISWLLKINQNGDSLLYRQFYKSNDIHAQSNFVWGFCITEDKSIVTCGYFQTDTAFTYLWLAKMDSLGCLQPGCQYVGVEELQKAKGELQIFPNPATTQTTITYPTIEKGIVLQIYNMLGQLIYEEKLPKGSNQTTINTNGYKSGLYKVVVGVSNGTVVVTD